jgi:uncharacterized protein YbaA (DUF1428 family)
VVRASVFLRLPSDRPAAHGESYDLKELLLTHATLGLYRQTGIQGHEITSQRSWVAIFLAAVPTANREKFRKHAKDEAVVFKEHGALKLVECWGDDVPDGEVTSFPMAVKRKDDETVVFSWITWPSRKARDEGMKKVMEDPRLKPDTNPMPFDGKRLIYGGFEIIVDE